MQQIDHYEIHQENMKRLQVITNTGNQSHSAPNSPMMRRNKNEQKNVFLSPMVQRKEANMSQENRSRSLNHLGGEGGARSRSSSPSVRSLSPGDSPIGSVSDRIIRTHYLSNTTGTPGSYLLKKSDAIMKEKAKRSPVGSPQVFSSPGLVRKGTSNNIPKKHEGPTTMLTVQHPPATIVISPAEEKSVIGFEVQETENTEKVQTVTAIKKQPKKGGDGDKHNKLSAAQQIRKEGQNINTQTEVHNAQTSDIRESIGLALLKPKHTLTPVEVAPTTKKQNVEKNKKLTKKEKKKAAKSKEEKLHRHHYIKYGDTHKSPGLLSPPTAPRGSKDLSAEMENVFQKKKERRLFNDLDHVEELSIGTSSEDHEESISGENDDTSAALKPPSVLTMPPVFDSIPTQLQARDYSIPMSLEDRELDEEEWERMKQCRYLRIEESEDEESGEEFSLSDDDEEDENKPVD